MQMPQPTHNSSEITGFPSSPLMMVSSPARTLGQNFIHSKAHRFGLHREDKGYLKCFSFIS